MLIFFTLVRFFNLITLLYHMKVIIINILVPCNIKLKLIDSLRGKLKKSSPINLNKYFGINYISEQVICCPKNVCWWIVMSENADGIKQGNNNYYRV